MSALYLHEIIDTVGQGASGGERTNFVLQGTWSVVGITGRWPQVVKVWDVPGGWDGWHEAVDRINVERGANPALGTGGVGRLLAGAPGCPSTDDLVAGDLHGSLFVHEIVQVRPGAALDYLAAVVELRVPMLADYGLAPTGLYETLLTDTEAITIWATDVRAHTAVQRAEHEARHTRAGDERLIAWRRTAREFVTSWREELMTPLPGMRIGPPLASESDAASARRAENAERISGREGPT